jgi:hypothetical protein
MKSTNVACLDILTTLSQWSLASSMPTNRGDIDAIGKRGHGSTVIKESQIIAEVKRGVYNGAVQFIGNRDIATGDTGAIRKYGAEDDRIKAVEVSG